jgi:N-methylhydantoinase B
VEPLEAQYPFVVRRWRLVPDSGGPGQWRGGLGTELVVELLGDAELTVRGDRIELPPPGAEGGRPGASGMYAVERADGTLQVLPTKAVGVRLTRGDRFVMLTSGGGGLGPPAARDRALVEQDVADGKVSREAATRVYGTPVDE